MASKKTGSKTGLESISNRQESEPCQGFQVCLLALLTVDAIRSSRSDRYSVYSSAIVAIIVDSQLITTLLSFAEHALLVDRIDTQYTHPLLLPSLFD